MATVSEMQAAILAANPSPSVVQYDPTWGPFVQNGVTLDGLVQKWCSILQISESLIIGQAHFPIVAIGTGAPTDTCVCGHFSATQTDEQRFRVLVDIWVAARVTAGWFVSPVQYGTECALAWGINATGVVQTAMLTWETSQKLALKVDLGFPVPGAPSTATDALLVLANDTTTIGFADGMQRRLTVTANRTLTTTIPTAKTICTLQILTAGTTSYTITFGAGFKPTGTLATGTTAQRLFCVTFRSDGTSLIEISRTAAIVFT